MTKSVLAIDAAWTSTEPSGVALLRQCQRAGSHWECLAACPSYAAFMAVARGEEFDWHAKHEGSVPEPASLLKAAMMLLNGEQPSLVTVDMPVATIPFSQRRAADQAISKEFGARWCSAHSPSRKRPGPLGANMSQEFQALGYPLATAVTPCGSRRHLVEVYPHPALLVLANADRRVPYKVSKSNKYWKKTSVQHRIRNLLDIFQMIQRALHQIVPTASVPLPQVEDVPSLAYLKRFEDALDALICAWVGIAFLNGNARSVGDDTAAIWLPME